ncbi:terminase large subunit domain-containing protein [Sphingomonas sp. LY160]|uniref:terminase large subunit domain-containing protein n=1 Tax=Sphingomonas sp. LY160 TaxID=3095342 RepID=UPI002ADEF001|nr:terminase family protein [Sphingomonas sp. LY160]MEA1071220.1 terminase family protein [Sphingomonas sp. LY160]
MMGGRGGFAALINGLSDDEVAMLVRSLTAEQARALQWDWRSWAHDGQVEPPSDPVGGDWRTWVMMAGRGFGKTRAGAEWVLEMVRGAATALASDRPSSSPSVACGSLRTSESETASSLRIALVGATVDEARRVMVEGESGLLTVAGPWVESWHPSRRRLTFVGGAEATLYSGASPDALRGPEHHVAWCGELAKWERARETWDMLQLGLRLGNRPRALVTTTPRPGPVLRGIMAPSTRSGQARVVVSGGPTWANPHLPAAFIDAVTDLYAGTHLGEQELEGRLAEAAPGQLWTSETIEACRVAADDDAFQVLPWPERAEPPFLHYVTPPAEPLRRRYEAVVIGVDPPSGGGTCGIVACARDGDGIGHVLGDHSVSGETPEGWATAVAAAAARYPDPVVVVVANQGGAMVRSVLRTAGAELSVKLVHARASKAARAEPVAMLFQQRRVRVHGHHAALEAELCSIIAGEERVKAGQKRDRADACIWAIASLMLNQRVPRVVAM